MLLGLVFKSFLVGAIGGWFAGPIFMLVMQRSITRGLGAGVASAMGTAIVEGAFFGLALGGLLQMGHYDGWLVASLELVGAVILLVLGIKILLANQEVQQMPVVGRGGLAWMMLTAALVTLSNPMAMLFYAGVAAKLFSAYLHTSLPVSHIIYSGLGVFGGSFWTLSTVSLIASRVGNFFSDRFQRVITSLMGIAFIGISLYLFFNFALLMWRIFGVVPV